MMTDAEIEKYAAWVDWRTPIKLRILEGGRTDWGCRLCIARHGLNHSMLEQHPKTQAEFEAHMKQEHPV